MFPRRRRSRRARAVIGATAIAASVVLSACGGDPAPPAGPTPSSSSAAPNPKPTPAPTPSKPKAKVDPLTGKALSGNAVVAVKIDDTAPGRPQVGIDKADIVYVEQVEGGLTRLAAVFHTHLPNRVESVRSVRANDPELLAQYGPIGFVASGGGGDAPATLRSSSLRPSVENWGGPGFSRDGSRPAPYNLRADLPAITKAVKAGPAKSIGLTWSASTASTAGTPAVKGMRTVVGSTPVGFDWNAKTKTWDRVIGSRVQRAASRNAVTTPNVIVQFCKGRVNRNDIDTAGNAGYFTESTGKGKVVVYRNGHAITGTWSRPNGKSGTSIKDAKGRTIPLAPGGAWVVLAATGASLTNVD